MTKEDFISRLSLDWKCKEAIEEIVNMFFESNVCIPKGDNSAYKNESDRKDTLEPIDAVIHMLNGGECVYLDGGVVVWNGYKFKYKNQGYGWSLNADFKYLRIKPSEPIYEWQWYRKVDGKVIDWSETFRTEQETSIRFDKPKEWYKFEETKRERK